MRKEMKFLGLVLVIIGLVFISSSASITGFAILEQVGGNFGNILGMIFIFAGIFLLIESNYDPIVKSFRRNLEKQHDRKVEYEEAEGEYNAAYGRHLRQKYAAQNYSPRRAEEEGARLNIERMNEAKKMLNDRYFPTKYSEFLRLAKKVGCEIKEGKEHSIPTYHERTLEPIPRHNGIGRGLSRKILKSLAEVA